VRQEEGPLILTEIISNSRYELESEASIGSFPLPVYTSLPLTPPPLLPIPIDSPPSHYNNFTISQNNLYQIIQQQQE